MREQYQYRTGNHPFRAFSDLVDHEAEKRRENHGEERNHGHHQTRGLDRDAESGYQDGGREFLERDDAAIEEDAEQG